jgi:hypothetical protein
MSGEWGMNDLRARVAQSQADIVAINAELDLLGGGGGVAAWGTITGLLTAQTDLQAALDGKTATGHVHTIANVTGLQAALDGKQAAGSYAAASHSHIIGDVTGLQAALDGKQAAGSYQPLATVLTNTTAAFTTAQETKLSGIATGATANSSDATLLARANHTGSQAISTVTGLQTALDGKETSGAATAAIAAHVAAGDPHPTYLTQAEAALLYAPIGGGGGSDPWTWQSLALNNTVSTVAYANVTGMSFTGTALAKYYVKVMGAYQAAATTTGIALALDVPAGATVIGRVVVNTTATAMIGLEQIADATATGVSTGVRAINTNTPIEAWFIVQIGATGGTVQLMQRSEIAASNTVLQAGLTVMGRRTL